jgi:hypothetical protein
VYDYLYPREEPSYPENGAITGANNFRKTSNAVNVNLDKLLSNSDNYIEKPAKIKRFVANINWKEMVPYRDFSAAGLKVHMLYN